MPTYDYKCEDCGHLFEYFQPMSDDPLKTCPDCKQDGLKRLIGGGMGIIFKGSGFYVNDAKKSPSNSKPVKAKSSDSSSSAASSGKKDSPKSAS